MFLVISGGIDMGNGIAVGLTNVLFAFVVSPVAHKPVFWALRCL